MRHFTIVAAARQAFDIGGLHIRCIGIGFMRTLQRLIRQTPITIAGHAG